jgi:excisionase family DNA binding protein
VSKDNRGYSDALENIERNSEALSGTHERQIEHVWLSPAEAIEYSGIGRTRFYGLLCSGEIPSAKLGRTRHIRKRDVDRFLEARMQYAEGK